MARRRSSRNDVPEPELRGPTMNVLFSRVALRDRTTADVLDLALRFLVTHRLAFAKAALVVIPPNLFVTYLRRQPTADELPD